MKTRYLFVTMLAAIVILVQAKGVAYGTSLNENGSLAPSGYLNVSGANSLLPDYMAAAVPSPSVVGGIDSMVVANVAASVPTYGNPGQNFSAIAANNNGLNNPVGAAPLVIPEPTTLVLTGFGGLIALIFIRRLGKTNRA